MKHIHKKALPLLLSATLVLGAGAAMASGGSKTDPLVTLSYLEDTVIPDILKQLKNDNKSLNNTLKNDLNKQITQYEKDLKDVAEGGAAGADTYVLVTLSSGQSLSLNVGCEMMLRVGSCAVNAATSPALIDITTAGSIDSGASLEKNHLYMATIPDRTLTPTSETVKLLVRGGYTVVDPTAPAAESQPTA